jgi:hypothetical protein
MGCHRHPLSGQAGIGWTCGWMMERTLGQTGYGGRANHHNAVGTTEMGPAGRIKQGLCLPTLARYRTDQLGASH